MNDHKADAQACLFTIYPVLRRAMYEAFDKQTTKVTRTQQIILITMSDMATLSMSELARKIDTSNEQATRAVTQLVNLGYIDRFQNEQNHRIVNIRLTEKAMQLLNIINSTAEEILADRYGQNGYSDIKKHLGALAASFGN